MRLQEQLEFRTPTKHVASGNHYRRCPTCRREVTLPCVYCRTRDWLESRKLNVHEAQCPQNGEG